MNLSTRALAFASRWFDPVVVHQTFEPLVADWQREWQDSPHPHRWLVSVRAMTAFACAVVISSPRVILTPISLPVARKVAGRVGLFCIIVGTVLGMPLALKFQSRLLDASWTETWLLRILPGTVMMAFPFSMVLAVDAIRDAATSARTKRSAALQLALVAVAFAFVAEGFLVPVASQTWRRISTPAGWNVPEPAAQETTTLALWRNPDRRTSLVPGNYTRANEIRATLIARAVVTVTPLVLILLRWSMLERSTRRRRWPPNGNVMTAFVAVSFYATNVAGLFAEHQLRWSAGNGLWLPVVIFGTWALFEQRRVKADAQQEA